MQLLLHATSRVNKRHQKETRPLNHSSAKAPLISTVYTAMLRSSSELQGRPPARWWRACIAAGTNYMLALEASYHGYMGITS